MAAERKNPVKRDLLLKINNDVYEVFGFIRTHPGEGINDVHLSQYGNKDVTAEFEKFHFTDLPEEWLLKARESKFDPNTGIAYVGQIGHFFPKKIPSFFHYWHQDPKAEGIIEDASSSSFLVIPVDETTVEFVSKSTDGKVERLRVVLKAGKWNAATNSDKFEVGISLDSFAEKNFISKGFKSI